ncbi:hypothetical protein K6Y31_11375 [Motilimonas cestriensis]|uniref:Sensor protein n=1 Tax=Motilimonas cestriensis TaxID=2742685 RepID=A0ABS8W8T7_9GAMM|nr:histidine kinase [Motilimonas cestriensis]MCE2595417.1 hypothetical protein [Motilimonas cestriensis]
MSIRQFNHSATSTLRRALVFIVSWSLLQGGLTLSITAIQAKNAHLLEQVNTVAMQSYQIGNRPHKTDLTNKIKISTLENALLSAPLAGLNHWYYSDQVLTSQQLMVSQWQQMQLSIKNGDWQSYNKHLASFSIQIENLVDGLKVHANDQTQWLFMVQFIYLLCLFPVFVFLMYWFSQQITRPLQHLNQAKDLISDRQFNALLKLAKDSKSNQPPLSLPQAVKEITTELGQHCLAMEEKVKQRTQELAKANQTVSFLYNLSQQLHVAKLSEQDLISALDQLVYQQLLKSAKLSFVNQQAPTHTVVSTSQWDDNNSEVITLKVSNQPGKQVLLHVQQNVRVDMRVLQSFALLLGQALAQQDIMLQSQRMALMEERSVIARELHDSIAQSLSFLRIQCTLLKRQINSQPELNVALTITSEIDQGVANAYKQLRELLSTFRLKVEEADLHAALAEMLAQLRPQTQADIVLRYLINDYHFNAGQYIHILQIIREATLNSIKHANATKITINCEYDETNRILIKVCDNGHGSPEVTEKQDHYGLNIMKERATKLQAQLIINATTEGTCVLLHFPTTSTESEAN